MKGLIYTTLGLVLFSFGFTINKTSLILSNFLNCDLTVEAGDNQIVCAAGETVNLEAMVSSNDYLTSEWTPSDLVSAPNSLTTQATVENSTDFTITIRAISDDNLIVNGDFSLDDTTTFISDYIYGTGGGVGLLSNEGQYAIASNAGDTHNQFANCSDHTGGGNMLVVNASGEADNVWCQTINVMPNTDYSFSAWVTSVVSQNPAQLQFSINGEFLGDVFNASASTCSWNQFSEFWNSEDVTTAEICIANVNFTPAGNDFALDDISFNPVCEITDQVSVTVLNLNAGFANPGDLCTSSNAVNLNSLLLVESTPGGQWTIDGNPSEVLSPSDVGAGTHTIRYVVSLDDCMVEEIQEITVFEAPNAGQILDPVMLCAGVVQEFTLTDLLAEEDPGGIWTETSALPSTNGAFDPVAGTFTTEGQAAGMYTFEYRVEGEGPCEDDVAYLDFILTESPFVEVGDDVDLTCDFPEAELGTASTSTGSDLLYSWTSPTGAPINQPNGRFLTVSEPGTYVLTVRNDVTGCQNSDQVIVTSSVEEMEAFISATSNGCSGESNGTITIDSVSGGMSPYGFSLDDDIFITHNQFTNLEAGRYEVIITDINGCQTSQEITITEPPLLDVVLNANIAAEPPTISLGDSVLLQAQVNIPEDQIDSIIWQPNFPNCSNCLSGFASPQIAESYSVTVYDLNGCTATDRITIFVEKINNIFIPNAFSPNDDGINDLFFINAGNDVLTVLSLQIVDRWGNMVFQDQNFVPNDPSRAWDGQFNGKRLNPGVFVFFAEIELKNGETVIEKGEINLLK